MRLRFVLPALAASLVALGPSPDAAAQQKTPPQWKLAVAWKAALESTPSAPAAFDTSHAYVALKGFDEQPPEEKVAGEKAAARRPAQIVAVSLADGTTAWRRELPAPVRALAAGDGLVFASSDDTLAAYSAQDGEPKWQLALDAPPVVPLFEARGWLIVATSKPQVAAVRAADGSRIWESTPASKVAAVPAVSGDALYLALSDNRVVRLSLQTGAAVWESRLASAPTTVLALDDRLFVGTTGKWFYAIDARNGHRSWRVRVGSDVTGVPAVDDKSVYFIAFDNLIRALDRNNGSLTARRVLARRALFGPRFAGNLIVVSGKSVTIEAFKAQRLQSAGTFDAPHELAGPIHVVAGPGPDNFTLVALTSDEMLALTPPARK